MVVKSPGCDKYPCSEFLVNVFHDGRYGWSGSSQDVHRGVVLISPDRDEGKEYGNLARKIGSSAILPTCLRFDTDWLLLAGVVSVERFGRDSHSTRWKTYTAVVLTSLLQKVLRDDRVLGHLEIHRTTCSSLTTRDLPCQEIGSIMGRSTPHLGWTSRSSSCYDQAEVIRMTNQYWSILREAVFGRKFQVKPKLRKVSISLITQETKEGIQKEPVENKDVSDELLMSEEQDLWGSLDAITGVDHEGIVNRTKRLERRPIGHQGQGTVGRTSSSLSITSVLKFKQGQTNRRNSTTLQRPVRLPDLRQGSINRQSFPSSQHTASNNAKIVFLGSSALQQPLSVPPLSSSSLSSSRLIRNGKNVKLEMNKGLCPFLPHIRGTTLRSSAKCVLHSLLPTMGSEMCQSGGRAVGVISIYND